MKSWNLSSFDTFTPDVLSSVDKDASVAVPSPRRRRRQGQPKSTGAFAAIGATVLIAAIGITPVRVNVCGTDDVLHITAAASMSNIQSNRPPLGLLFGGQDSLKWTSAQERAMLTKAAAVLAASSGEENEFNMIHSVLREGLPHNRGEADDLNSLRKKLG